MSINEISLSDVGMQLPAQGVITSLTAFEIDLSGENSNLPLQLAIKVPSEAVNAETGQLETLKPGTEVFFWKKGTIRDVDGTEHDTWWLVDNGFIGTDGVARTASPPYKGSAYQGTYIVSYRQSKEQYESGEIEVRGVNYESFMWNASASIALAVGMGMSGGGLAGAMMGVSALGILASIASPTVTLSYTIAGSFKREVVNSELNSALINKKITLPDIPAASLYTPIIQGYEYNAETREVTVNAKNVIPDGQSGMNFDVKVWLVPRGNQIDRPSDLDIKKNEYPDPDRGLIYQGFRTDPHQVWDMKVEQIHLNLPCQSVHLYPCTIFTLNVLRRRMSMVWMSLLAFQ